MTTARSRFDFAIARMDAAIAKIHEEVRIERELPALPSHHLGCTLPPDHEGDCSVPRIGRFRCMKLPLIGGALAMALAMLVGCSSPPAPAPMLESTVDRCINASGWRTLIAAECPDGQHIAGASCGADGGAIDMSIPTSGEGWECSGTWEGAMLGTVCVHLTCSSAKPDTKIVTLGEHGCDVCENEVPQ